jgi:hypothetical protein
MAFVSTLCNYMCPVLLAIVVRAMQETAQLQLCDHPTI